MRLKKIKMMAKMKKKADKFITKESDVKPEVNTAVPQTQEEDMI